MYTTYYTVFTEGQGDIFKGYTDRVISSHLSKYAADAVAKRTGGWAEAYYDNLHEDYIKHLLAEDRKVLAIGQSGGFIYYIDAQNKAGQWKSNRFKSLRELIHTWMHWKALQYPTIFIQRRIAS